MKCWEGRPSPHWQHPNEDAGAGRKSGANERARNHLEGLVIKDFVGHEMSNVFSNADEATTALGWRERAGHPSCSRQVPTNGTARGD